MVAAPMGFLYEQEVNMLKFIYSEKATNYVSYVVMVKSTVEISQNFMASEYMNFRSLWISSS